MKRTEDDGTATVWVLAAGLLGLSVAIAFATAGGAMVARHRAESAADLAAIAGAIVARQGPDVACGRASLISSANGATLVACELDGLDVTVHVEVAPAGAAALAGVARGAARAGPAE